MDSAWNLEYIFKLIFQEHSHRNIDQLTSLIDSLREKTEVHDNNGGDISNGLEKVLGSIKLLLKIFNSNYETRFDIFIEYIFDQIQNIIQFGIDRSILSDLPLGNIINLMDLILDISISHSCKGIMTKLVKFYTCMLKALKGYDFALSEVEESVLNLRIISNFYVVINKKKFESPAEDMKQLITDINADGSETELFAKLVFSSSKVIAAQTLINVIPVYMEFSGTNKILQLIWDKISQSLAGNNYEFSKVFIVLCYLSDAYFAAENKKLIHDIFKCNSYWVLLQKGLVHSDSCVRKQALFLLKKSCHYLKENQISWIEQDEGVSDISKTSESYVILLKCDWNAMFDVFSELWCIIEYLEETQIHLLEPIIDVVDSFTARNKEKLDISWILVIIQRMIGHDNMTIIKKGFLNMLKIPICDYHNEILADAAKLLVSTLKCTQMYSNNWQVVVDELKVYFDACSRQGNGKKFFKLLLNEIANVRWGPEALFFVMYALKPVEPNNYWGRNELDLIKKILNGTMNHYTDIKSATQGLLLNITIDFLVSHDVTLDDVASLLTCFDKNKCLTSDLWRKIVKWVRDSYETEDVEKYLERSISDHTESVNIGKMILILYEAYSDSKEMTQKITNLLRNIFSSFADAHVRPYSDAETQEFYLSIACDLMAESSWDRTLMTILRPFFPDILKYIEMRLDCSHHIRDFEKSQDLLKKLETVLNRGPDLFDDIIEWFDKIIRNLFMGEVKFLPLEKLLQIQTLIIFMDNYIRMASRLEMEMKFVRPFLKSELCAPLEKTAEDSIVTEDLQKLWGKINSEYLKQKWMVLYYVSYVAGSPLDVLRITNSDFIQLCLDAVDTGGAPVLLHLLSVLNGELPFLLQEPQLTQMMDTILSVIMERKKNDDFYYLVLTYIRTTFQLGVISTEEENIRGMLLEHSRQLLSENNVNIAKAFIRHVQKLELIVRGKYFLLVILPWALLFGQIQRKDERLISDICTIIEKENISPLKNDHSTNVEVRAVAISIVVKLNRGNKGDCEFAEDLMDALIQFEENVNKNKTRYFADSNAHRYKERLMQSLLVLVPLISEVKQAKLWTWVLNKLLFENNQPSVRYLQEWLILRLIYKCENSEDRLWECFVMCTEKSTRGLCSLISIMYHLIDDQFLSKNWAESWLKTAFRILLQYSMAQHFSVRLYAQVTLQKLMDFIKAPCYRSVRLKYGVVSEILSESIRSGNAVKNCSKMLEDFYFTKFHPRNHYTLETIFYEFPRLTSAGSQELIPVSLFGQYDLKNGNCIIPVKNWDNSLKNFTYGKWIVDGSNQIDIFADSEENKETELSNLQKKMIPIKYLVPDVEDLLQFVSYSANDKNKEGLIVVGSLIDRLPNLGGLSRTCEVFGVSEFVIGSLKYLEDQQFKSLSVTAEKWIPITEVKPYHLSEYLTKMKLNGYTILAAEQTVNSQPLESVKFPKKSILLLGNEKEGIPPTLLPLTDVCVEIPQKGIIRSLNVHVTGALFIWEYAKQHNSFTRI